jgi:hypothetical protein
MVYGLLIEVAVGHLLERQLAVADRGLLSCSRCSSAFFMNCSRNSAASCGSFVSVDCRCCLPTGSRQVNQIYGESSLQWRPRGRCGRLSLFMVTGISLRSGSRSSCMSAEEVLPQLRWNAKHGLSHWVEPIDWTGKVSRYFPVCPCMPGLAQINLLPFLLPVTVFRAFSSFSKGISALFSWLPPRDSNPDMLIQSQLSYH